MRRVLTGILFLFSVCSLLGQGIKFNETSHNFSHVHEEKGVVKHSFAYFNTLNEDVLIQSVESPISDCLTFEWDKRLASGETKRLTVILNPNQRKGMFDLPVEIKTLEKGKQHTYKLNVRAYIIPIPRTIEEKYGMLQGNLRYKTNQKAGLILHREEVLQDTFFFYNVWDSEMTFSYDKLPHAVKILYLTPSLKPKEEGILVFTYNAKLKNNWGLVWDKFVIMTNDPVYPEKTFHLSGDIYENFSTWTPEQLENAPHIFTQNGEYNFGTRLAGDKITYDFVIKNTGKSTLKLYRLKSSCGCTTSQLEKNELQPGESTVIKATFNTVGKKGNQLNTIDIITNDPDQPKLRLLIEGHIKP